MQKTENNLGWRGLIKGYVFLLGKRKKLYLFYDFCLLLLLFYSVIPPLLLGKIIDFFDTYKSNGPMSPFYAYVITLGVSFAIVSFLRLTLKNRLENLRSEIGYDLKLSGFERLMDFSLEWHDQQMVGEKTQKISNGVTAINDLSTLMENVILQAIATFLGIVAVFIFLKPYFLIFFLLYFAVYLTNVIYFNVRIQKKIHEQNISLEKSSGAFVEGLSNLLTLKTLGASSGYASHIAVKEEQLKRNNIEISNLVINLWRVFQFLNGLSYAVFLFLIGKSIVSGDISAGMLVIFYGSLQSLISVSGGMMDIYERVSRDRSQIIRMLPIYQTTNKVKSGRTKFPANWKKLSIIKGDFKYHSTKGEKTDRELSDIDLEIQKFSKSDKLNISESCKIKVISFLTSSSCKE